MLVKNILAIFSIATLAAAAPAEDLEARAPCSGTAFCCKTVSSLSIFFVKGVGSGDCRPAIKSGTTPPDYSCPSGKKLLCCASGRQLVDKDDGDVVCIA